LVDLLSLHSTPLANPDCTVSAFINDDRTWNVQALRRVISDEQVVQKVLGIEDSFCWGFSGSGTFSVKSATWLAHDHVEHTTPAWEFNWIWKIDAPPKILIFLWQMLHNALPIRVNLCRRGFQVDAACPLCAGAIETNDHLFWECPSTQ